MPWFRLLRIIIPVTSLLSRGVPRFYKGWNLTGGKQEAGSQTLTNLTNAIEWFEDVKQEYSIVIRLDSTRCNLNKGCAAVGGKKTAIKNVKDAARLQLEFPHAPIVICN